RGRQFGPQNPAGGRWDRPSACRDSSADAQAPAGTPHRIRHPARGHGAGRIGPGLVSRSRPRRQRPRLPGGRSLVDQEMNTPWENPVKKRLREGLPVVAATITVANPDVAAHAATLGFDFLWVEM